MKLTDKQLSAIMPNLKPALVTAYLPYLNAAMEEAAINTKARVAAFLAQIAHESGQLRWWTEIWTNSPAQQRYDTRTDLGNTPEADNDGFLYRGRSPIQLTGKANYKACGDAIGVDLVNNPDRADDLDVGFRICAWFWTTRKLNVLADKGDFKLITKRINGGYNGLADREKYHVRALAVL